MLDDKNEAQYGMHSHTIHSATPPSLNVQILPVLYQPDVAVAPVTVVTVGGELGGAVGSAELGAGVAEVDDDGSVVYRLQSGGIRDGYSRDCVSVPVIHSIRDKSADLSALRSIRL
jgi:hypothetical protein